MKDNNVPGEAETVAVILAAVAVTETGEISAGHFGEAPRIRQAEIRPGRVLVMGDVPNPIRGGGPVHGSEKKLNTAGEFLKSVRILVAGRRSPNFVKLWKEKGKWPVVGSGDAWDALDWISRNLDTLAAWFEDDDHIVFPIPGDGSDSAD